MRSDEQFNPFHRYEQVSNSLIGSEIKVIPSQVSVLRSARRPTPESNNPPKPIVLPFRQYQFPNYRYEYPGSATGGFNQMVS